MDQLYSLPPNIQLKTFLPTAALESCLCCWLEWQEEEAEGGCMCACTRVTL